MNQKSLNHDPNIKIYVVCHKPSYVPPNPYLYPIQVGTALAKEALEGMLHDNEGDNISKKIKATVNLPRSIGRGRMRKQTIMAFFITEDIFHLILS